jgi:hypothetical protein
MLFSIEHNADHDPQQLFASLLPDFAPLREKLFLAKAQRGRPKRAKACVLVGLNFESRCERRKGKPDERASAA